MDSSVCTLQSLSLSSAAVRITDAYKRYGNPSKGKVVLDHLNMTVPRGVIYGLLGASGCGKTTLLSCIVGRRDLNSGDIWVLGGKPGTRGSGVPGPRVGYMPQEVALVGEFTVKGAIYYFGNIYGMSSERLHERFQFLSRLLDLPPADRLVNQLSGGQQRRVSFASALVHEPELLILDEPTVGLDPVLRENMWNHLVDLTSKQNVAVIITTHYIEEARLAHSIGLMRGGRLLAEDSPSHLMTLFGCDTLEDVFLILSEKQSRGEVVQQLQDEEYRREKLKREAELGSKNTLVSSTADVTQFSSTTAITKDLSLEKRIKKAEQVLHPGRIKALFTKNMLQFTRHPGGLIFTLLFPIIEIVAFFSAVGGDLKYLKMAIVNHESNEINCYNYTSQYKTAVYDPSNFTCNLNMLSCRFLNSLNETTISQIHYDDLDQALDSVKNGQTIGVVYFSENFTQAMEARREDGRHTTDYDLDSAEIQVYLDMAEHTKANTLRKYLLDKYISFSEGMFKDCNEPLKLGSIPVNFFEPVYGKSDYTYTIFTAPGMIVTMVFFLAAIITSTIIITDRLEGTWDRSMVAGITTSELMLTHFVTQFIVMAAQNFLILLFSLVVYELPLKGSALTVLFLLLLQGLAGMSYGFLTSVVSSSHTMANFALTGSFYPVILLSGMMWPIESMPTGLMWFSLCLPCTFPIISLRNVIFKGWLFTHWSIFGGYLITFGWIAVFCILSFFILRQKM